MSLYSQRLTTSMATVAVLLWAVWDPQSYYLVPVVHSFGIVASSSSLSLCRNPQSTVLFATSSQSSDDTTITTTTTTTTTPSTTSTTTTNESWTFRGHAVYTEVTHPTTTTDSMTTTSKMNQPITDVLLIHGFGCSSTYWRATKDALVQHGYTVHCLDLLGQGKSAKPGRDQNIHYSIHLWAALIDSYIQHHIIIQHPTPNPVTTNDNDNPNTTPTTTNNGIVLCGNSLGSLVALSAVTGDFRPENQEVGGTITVPSWVTNQYCKGICMFNCGVGLNSRGIANEDQWTPTQRFLINALYNVLDVLIFRNTILLSYVLNHVVTKDLLRSTLQSLYKFQPDRVDDELVDSFYMPAKDTGSVEALSQIYTNDPGVTPMDLHRKYDDILLRTLPLHLIWGNDDAVTPLQGGVGQYYTNMAKERSNVSFQVVSSGHIPFDDNPNDSHQSMLQWLHTLSTNNNDE